MGKSKIEWCDRTWNPVTGCTQISPGCANCYAKRMTERFAGPWGLDTKNPFAVKLHPEKLEEPLRWKKPSKVFVCSMSDLFHEDVPFSFIEGVFEVMEEACQHTFLVLTKRPARMASFMAWYEKECSDPSVGMFWNVAKNIWIGVTAENQEQADKRIPILLQIPAAKRFVSVEPMLGPVNLNDYEQGRSRFTCHNNCNKESEETCLSYENTGKCFKGIDWVICGGESGPNARPMHPDWARGLRDQCKAAGTPFMFKQWGEWAPYINEEKFTHDQDQSSRNEQYYVNPDGTTGSCWLYDEDGTWTNWTGDPKEDCCVVSRVGKKAAGRLLDGELWDQYPEGK